MFDIIINTRRHFLTSSSQYCHNSNIVEIIPQTVLGNGEEKV